MMKVYICEVCGHIEFNDVPEQCPVCMAPKDKFSQNDNVFKESQENSPEAEVKHLPSITINKDCGLIPEASCVDAIIRIGETLHPMEEAHFIKFIDCYLDGRYIERIELSPSVFAAGCVHMKATGKEFTVVENCNIHGYWMKTLEM